MNEYKIIVTDTDKNQHLWFVSADNQNQALSKVMPELFLNELEEHLAIQPVKIEVKDN